MYSVRLGTLTNSGAESGGAGISAEAWPRGTTVE
jgi:hypothetical protein